MDWRPVNEATRDSRLSIERTVIEKLAEVVKRTTPTADALIVLDDYEGPLFSVEHAGEEVSWPDVEEELGVEISDQDHDLVHTLTNLVLEVGPSFMEYREFPQRRVRYRTRALGLTYRIDLGDLTVSQVGRH